MIYMQKGMINIQRQERWIAHFENDKYAPLGHGRTKSEALSNAIANWEETHEYGMEFIDETELANSLHLKREY